MIYIGLLIAGISLIISLIVLIITIFNGNKNNKKDVFVDGGYNIETGLKEDLSGKIFVGIESKSADTYMMYEGGTQNSVTINIYNLSKGQNYQYVNVHEIYIGRDANRSKTENYLYIGGDGAISKVHCRILVNASEVLIEDMHSSNHTYLNGSMIHARERINRGDIIKIGRTKLKVEI